MNGMSRAHDTAVDLQDAAETVQNAALLIQSIAHSLDAAYYSLSNDHSTDPTLSPVDSNSAADRVSEKEMAQRLTTEDIQAALILAEWRRKYVTGDGSNPPQLADSKTSVRPETRLPRSVTDKEVEAAFALTAMRSGIRLPSNLTSREIEAALALTDMRTSTSANKDRSKGPGVALTNEDIQAALTLTRLQADTSADKKPSSNSEQEDDSDIELDEEAVEREFVQKIESLQPRHDTETSRIDRIPSRASVRGGRILRSGREISPTEVGNPKLPLLHHRVIEASVADNEKPSKAKKGKGRRK